MDITRIVLTGGPCAGKSTGLATVEQKLNDLGYKVIIMDEMPTNVLRSGLTPADLGISFQELLVNMQLDRDKAYNNIIKNLSNDKVVIIYDRGILDCQAYCDEAEFSKILSKYNTSRSQLFGFYDGVFHLVTAADGAEEFYTTANNSVRLETPEQARTLDKLTLKSWIGHPHLRVIGNEGVDFSQKIHNLLTEITSLLGEPIPLEIEKKYLIKMPDLDTLVNKYGATKCNIVQTYLVSKQPGVERRIRQRGINADNVYYYTEKKDISKGKRQENERKISRDEYISYLTETDISLHQIVKTRYCMVYKNRYFEIDTYKFWTDKAIL